MIGWAVRLGVAFLVVLVVAHFMGGTEAVLDFVLDLADEGVDTAREQTEGGGA